MQTFLIPALLDHHWPLLRWAFETRERHAVILEESGSPVEEPGLRHMRNDLCDPFALIAGQVLLALRSGKYEPENTAVLISQAADGCRGSCLIRLLRPVLDKAGFSQVSLLALNTKGLEGDHALPVTPVMAARALAAAFRGDALMLLGNQTRPYETAPGETDRLTRHWTEWLTADLRENKNLMPSGILRRCREIAADFRTVPRAERTVQKVAIVGELYTKYRGLGPAFSKEIHLYSARRGLFHPAALPGSKGAGAALRLCSGLRLVFAGGGRRPGEEGPPEVLAAMPFGCLPGHIYARGIYARLQRELWPGLIVGVDYDASIREGTVQNRIRMPLDTEI